MRIDYNPITGMIMGACIGIFDYSAFQIGSNYNHDIITRSTPIIDGVVLENGRTGSQVKVTQIRGMTYSFDSPIFEGLAETLYLAANPGATIS